MTTAPWSTPIFHEVFTNDVEGDLRVVTTLRHNVDTELVKQVLPRGNYSKHQYRQDTRGLNRSNDGLDRGNLEWHIQYAGDVGSPYSGHTQLKTKYEYHPYYNFVTKVTSPRGFPGDRSAGGDGAQF